MVNVYALSKPNETRLDRANCFEDPGWLGEHVYLVDTSGDKFVHHHDIQNVIQSIENPNRSNSALEPHRVFAFLAFLLFVDPNKILEIGVRVEERHAKDGRRYDQP